MNVAFIWLSLPLFMLIPALAYVFRRNLKATLSSIFLIVAGTALLYPLLGNPTVMAEQQAREAALADLLPQIEYARKDAEKDKTNVRSWERLGQLYMEAGQYEQAAQAYRQAVVYSGGHVGLILQYNKALTFAAGGQVTDDAKKGFEAALMIDPENTEARYFLALKDLQDGNLTEAMQGMKALYAELKPGDPLKAIIDRQIGRQ